jgi:hypothetical protein
VSRDRPAVVDRCSVFGNYQEGDFGLTVHLRVTPPRLAVDVPGPTRVPIFDGETYLVAPLLTLVSVDDQRFVLVGRCEVLVNSDQDAEMHAIIEEAWMAPVTREADGHLAPRGWKTISDHPELGQAVKHALQRPRHREPGVMDARPVVIAKAVAEHTRNAVSELRSLRYSAERTFGARLRGRGSDVDLADLVELSIAASRARDLCRESVREQLWAWRTEKANLDTTRDLHDGADGESSARTRRASWLSVLDAGVRHCQAAGAQLEDEAAQLHRLLEAASTISVARDARAQEQFNFVATVGAVTLGLPALVLGVYGAAQPDFRQQLWIVPFMVCGVASLAVSWLLTNERVEVKPLTLTLIAVCATLGISQFAVWVAQ